MTPLNKLGQNRDEILKAEIGALLFNLGKTHIGFSFWRDYFPHKTSEFKFSSYKNYPENYLYNELEEISPQLEKFFKDLEINLDFLKINIIELIKGGESKENFIKQVFFKGCENINSGIDKGSPNKQLKPPLWLSNAFGSFKEKINEFNFDKRRQCFFMNLSRFLSNKDYYVNPNWKEIRNFILKEIKDWYSHLLSDSRFPVNDVSLFDQAYMTVSMFKAVLAQLVIYQTNQSSIKWRILGIQYDKMGLAEKGFKLASIRWYRNISREIDDAIKELIEVEYPIGNEIYRDETGIYFIVGECLGDDSEENSIVPLKQEFKELEDRILEVFKEKTKDEFYPAIYLTKASRGLMNLTTLLEKANENFLKANWKQKNLELPPQEKDRGRGIGICPVCKTRLIYKKDKERKNKPVICKVCNNRIHYTRTSSWINNLNGETIWTDEIKDRNSCIACVSLSFKVDNWLNGDLLNSLLVNKNNFAKLLSDIKLSILKEEELVKRFHKLLESYFQKINTNFISLGTYKIKDLVNDLNNKSIKKDTKGRIIAIYRDLLKANLYNNLNNYIVNSISSLDKIKEQNQENFFGYISKLIDFLNSATIKILKSILDNERTGFGKFEENIEFLRKYIHVSPQIKNLMLTINTEASKIAKIKIFLHKENKKYPEIEKILNDFIPFSISEEIVKYFGQYRTLKNFYRELFFSSIMGTPWEDWIKRTHLKINWEKEEIEWNKFNSENDISLDILTVLLLQFLLRKNPSPARLRRIWESTQEFFKEIHNNLDSLLEIPEWRKKRLVWEIEKSNEIPITKEEELEGNGLKFLARPDKDFIKIYLISSIEDFLRVYGKDKTIKAILNKKDVSPSDIKDYLEDFEIRLKDSSGKNKNIALRKEIPIGIHNYKPFSLVTDISPVNYQVIIPAEYVPKFIDKVIEEYDRNFKYVYGKLPLHIGIITSHYKKPLYVSLKALRRIRRGNINTDKLWQKKDVNEFCQLQKKKLKHATSEELVNKTEEYYSLYFDNPDRKEYQFYIKPDEKWKKWISTVSEFPLNSQVEMIPNTFDFEFMDTNTRRNDIFYDEKNHYKRALPLKSNRPYELEIYWPKFKEFYEIFKDKNKSAKLHRLIELLYEKVQNYNEAFRPLLASAFVNILELRKDNETLERIQRIFDLDTGLDILKALERKLTEENIKLFIDMFEFWHTALKEV